MKRATSSNRFHILGALAGLGLLCTGSALRAAAPPSATPTGATPDWMAAVRRDIEAREYQLSPAPPFAAAAASWQAPNRAQGIRTHFSPSGIELLPREAANPADAPWRIDMDLTAVGRADHMQPVASSTPTTPTTSANQIAFHKGDITESYLNDEKGLKQNFVIESAPAATAGSGELLLELSLSTTLRPRLTPNRGALEFLDGVRDQVVMRYTGLRVMDAAGKALDAHLALDGADASNDPAAGWSLQIVVDDAGAQYPVTVDPLFTGAADATIPVQFYIEIFAAAGDVNGDGYDDVVMGNPSKGNPAVFGMTGAAYIYLGSAAGLATTPATTILSDQSGSQFGASIAGAGDVNADGYADIIVGAPEFNKGHVEEGVAFIFLGSANGIASGSQALASATIESNQDLSVSGVGTHMGASVAGAGDINGDGYDDVIVGAPGYHNPQVAFAQNQSGAVAIYLGSATGIKSASLITASTFIPSTSGQDRIGEVVAGIGDINGDGYGDVMFSEHNGSTGGAFIFLGSASGIPNGNQTTASAHLLPAGQSASYVYTEFGRALAGAGDVNGDGYADVIIGAKNYFKDGGTIREGSAFIFLGSPTGIHTGTTANAATTLRGDNGFCEMGQSVAGAGDVNGDGYADVMVGARHFSSGGFTQNGAAMIFLGSDLGIPTGGPADAAFFYSFYRTSAYTGSSVAGAGDVNGDGFADVMLNVPYQTNASGVALVFNGSSVGVASGNPSRAGATYEANQIAAHMGFSVATAGDVNGDGYADVIIGAPNYDNGQTDEGAAFIYAGSPYGVFSGNPTTALSVLDSNQANVQFGASVASAGDMNGDGYADVIVGSPDYTYRDMAGEGAGFVFLGSPTGTTTFSASTAALILHAEQAGAQMGSSVAGAGDVNGDGLADVIVGAPLYDTAEADEGAAFVFLGAPSWASRLGDPTTAHATLESDQASSNFGASVAGAGDVNGDGYADVIVGAPDYDKGETDEGVACIFTGSPLGIASAIPDNAATLLEGNQASARLGYSVSGAGLVNGDRFSDVIIGAWNYSNSGANAHEGAAFIFNGALEGIASGGAATAATKLSSSQGASRMGWSVAGAGDVNGDSFSDVIVGLKNYNNGESLEGIALIWQGAADGIPSGGVATAATLIDSNQVSANLGQSVAGAGDVNGDGFSDVIVGAPNYDKGESDEGAAFIFYGNRARGLAKKPQQLRFYAIYALIFGSTSDSNSAFRLGVRGRAPHGRAWVKMEWEVKPIGRPFDGTGIGAGADFALSSPGGAALKAGTDAGILPVLDVPLLEDVGGLLPGTPYHWRLRVRNKPGVAPFTRFGPWMTQYPDGSNEVRTAGVAATGRDVADFDDSGCTDLNDFLFLLDYWQTVSPIGGAAIGLSDFLALLDNWQAGAGCP